MKCKAIIDALEVKYPVSAAEDWDNPGLIVGQEQREVHKIYLTLDVTNQALAEAIDWGADMIISHHPMIFSSLRQINNRDFIGKKVMDLIENHISYYAMHTNFDVCRMAEINARLLCLTDTQVLYVTEKDGEKEEGIGRVGMLPEEMSLRECASYVKECYHLPQVKVFGNLEASVHLAAVSGGSGKSMVKNALRSGADVLITGDIDHHTGLDAVDQGLAVIDAGHYGTEYFFMEQVKKDLQALDLSLEVRCAPMEIPFSYV